MKSYLKIILIIALAAAAGAFVYYRYQDAKRDSDRMGRDLELIQEVLQEHKQRATSG
jgi:hypothetical protein